MAIQEVIKYEGDNNTLIYKHPAEDFNTLSKLIVHESQLAIFFNDGQALDTFTPGRYTLETKNIPLISKLRNLVTGGVSPFHCEIYFINMATAMNVFWGTPSQATVRDPNYGYSYNVGANGSMALKIIDGRNLLVNLVGTESTFTVSQVQKYFKDMIVTRVTSYLASELEKSSYNAINSRLSDISLNLQNQLVKDFLPFGIEIFNFFVASINIDPHDLSELKKLDNSMASKRFEAMGNRDAMIFEAQGLDQARKIQGFTWQEEKQFDISKTFAQNEGFASNPANMMAQIPVAFSMGNMLNNNIEKAYNSTQADNPGESTPNQNTPASSGNITCDNCGSVVPGNARFCISCGKEIMRKKMFCPHCGASINPNARFCSQCGGKIQ